MPHAVNLGSSKVDRQLRCRYGSEYSGDQESGHLGHADAAAWLHVPAQIFESPVSKQSEKKSPPKE